MKSKKIDELLNKQVQSPAPMLKADPFLATRVQALAGNSGYFAGKAQKHILSFMTIVTTCALILGVYIGMGITDTSLSQTNDDVFTEYSQAFYQSGLIENWNTRLSKEE